jgi:hypothetical protein
MNPLYTEKEFSEAKNSEKLPFLCQECNNTFFRSKSEVKRVIKYKQNSCVYCSQKCKSKSEETSIVVKCGNCGKEKKVMPNIIRASKSGHIFCSKSCSVTYNNTHKTKGYRRSKLELYIEDQLIVKYPQLDIHFNRKDTIGSELDIYIPSLSLAFELNGVFHYEPIFGKTRFKQIAANDISKHKACLDAEIDLCVIDTSTLHYFKPANAQKYLDIVVSIINDRL